MPEPITLETPRLRLRQWLPQDRAPFAALNADPQVMEFFPAVRTRAESDQMADRCQALIEARGWGLWAAELKATLEHPQAGHALRPHCLYRLAREKFTEEIRLPC